MSKIELKHIDKFYGKNHILKDVNLTIEDGDFMTLLGPSGCGKTTTLRVVSGLEKPQNGTIHMDGKEIVNAAEAHFAPPSERDLNLVFQSYALWPHMTVRENIALARPEATEAEIEAAAKAAHAHGFITRLPQGYDTPLTDNGMIGNRTGQFLKLSLKLRSFYTKHFDRFFSLCGSCITQFCCCKSCLNLSFSHFLCCANRSRSQCITQFITYNSQI